MKNQEILMWLGAIIVSSVAFLIHLFAMIDTAKGVHLICALLWAVVWTCSMFILDRTLRKAER